MDYQARSNVIAPRPRQPEVVDKPVFFNGGAGARSAPQVSNNQAIIDGLTGGLDAKAPGFGVSISGEEVRDYLSPDTSDRRMIERARASERGAWNQLEKDITQNRGAYGLQAQVEGDRARDETYGALIGQERQAYGDAIAQNTYAAARGGQVGGSANRNREGRLYESSLQRRLEASSRAAQAGQTQRQSILDMGNQIEGQLVRAAMLQPNMDKSFLDTYQNSRYGGQSDLSMNIEDVLAQIGWTSAMDAAGVRNAGKKVS